jgi:4'-phosphopantetheinyl transferase
MTAGIRWLLQCREDMPEPDGWLSTEERSAMSTLRFERRRDDWLLGRWTSKKALAMMLDPALALPRISVLAAADGAPEAFLDGHPLDASLSISHRDGVAVAAVRDGGRPLGCDIELVEHRAPVFALDYLTPGELSQLHAWPDVDLAVTVLWSAKESVLKTIRSGLRDDPLSVEASPEPGPGGAWRPAGALHKGDRFHGWWRREDGFVVTMASAEELPIPRLLQPQSRRTLMRRSRPRRRIETSS